VARDDAGIQGLALVRTKLNARFRFFSRAREFDTVTVHRGTVRKIGGDGLVLEADLMKREIILGLLTGRVLIGVNLYFPLQNEPVKVLTRLVRIEPAEDKSRKVYHGLRFEKISVEDRERVRQFIFRCQL